MLSCSILFSAPSFWMGGGLESRCVGRVYGAGGVVRLALNIFSNWPQTYSKFSLVAHGLTQYFVWLLTD